MAIAAQHQRLAFNHDLTRNDDQVTCHQCTLRQHHRIAQAQPLHLLPNF
ncbi:MAG: hypothetical protein SNJ67_03280 [Chloracidobacterium sp.]|uniref:Uncharacterized protein n=1 Tax=Chloracidobacterium validum TaxID=2821543 RepID=A0ABX8B6N7_9BACT|nr:hypothetical protein [Chloracidobacterium validum]QUW02296.1 hypothetical protein J8C06_07980 [Chloracidobacterium validum]